MHVLSAMWLQRRLLAAVAILLHPTGVASQSASCPVAKGTTPIWSTAECGTFRGVALLAVQWRRSLVADDQATENVTADSLAAVSVSGPAGTELSLHSNASTATSLYSNVSMDTISTQASMNATWTPANLSGPPIMIASENSTEIIDDSLQTWRSSENGSDKPLGKDQFEPFGYPGAGLLLELHMPQVTLRELHSSSHGSLASFLQELRGELSKAADVEERRMSILGIYGRFKRLDGEGFLRTATEHVGSDAAASPPSSSHVDEEVIVRFEVLPGWGSNDAEPREVLDILRNELRRKDSGLQRSSLGTKLDNASLSLSAPAGLGSLPRASEHRGMAHMSAMAWPIGISAAFIGVLIWLAAY